MTLSNIADYVCLKVGQTDADSIAACKSFANVRYKMIWDAALWRDTLALVSVTTTAGSNWLLMPVGIERVLKVRVDTTTIGPFDAGTVFDFSPDLFDNQGTPAGFMTFAPVVLGPMDGVLGINVLNVGASASDDLEVTATYEVEYNAAQNVLGNDTLVATHALRPSWSILGTGVQFLLRFDKGVTAVGYELDYNSTQLFFGANDISAPRRARIKLLQGPATATACLVQGKRACPGLNSDTDTPLLRNIDNALVAFAQSDMLERQRQYSKAAAKAQEAAGQLKIMLNLELEQSANVQRIIPEDVGSGMYWDSGFGPGKYSWGD